MLYGWDSHLRKKHETAKLHHPFKNHLNQVVQNLAISKNPNTLNLKNHTRVVQITVLF
jgi:hypothetical protein